MGTNFFDFTPELLKTIREQGANYMFMTNNSSKSVIDYVKKLEKLGISATEDDFITSSQATAWYLLKEYQNKTLYVCGTKSLKDELINYGFEITEDIEKTDIIVIGNDTELKFKKLHDISYMLLTREIPYIATNPDYVCPTEFGFVPDCGSFCDMLYNATKKRPIFIGKPEPLIPQLAMEKHNLSGNQTAVIGDRIYTDVKCGINAGAVSILVMSGETTYEILDKSADKPDFVLTDCSEITKALKL